MLLLRRVPAGMITSMYSPTIFVNVTLNSSPHIATYMRQWIGPALVQVMVCRIFGAKPLSKPVLGYYQLDP